MFIELPTSLAARAAEPGADLPLDFDPAETFTAVPPRRGERPMEAVSRVRLALPRDARQWPWRTGVAGSDERPATLTV